MPGAYPGGLFTSPSRCSHGVKGRGGRAEREEETLGFPVGRANPVSGSLRGQGLEVSFLIASQFRVPFSRRSHYVTMYTDVVQSETVGLNVQHLWENGVWEWLCVSREASRETRIPFSFRWHDL